VGLASLAGFMESVERAQYPIVFSRLDIRKRLSESDSYDVELIASAYDRKEAAKNEVNPSGTASSIRAEQPVQRVKGQCRDPASQEVDCVGRIPTCLLGALGLLLAVDISI